jgi:transposase
MQTITTIGLDIAKSVFQVHGVDAQGGCRMRAYDRDLISGGHYGQRPVCRTQRPNTWLHRPRLQT